MRERKGAYIEIDRSIDGRMGERARKTFLLFYLYSCLYC